ncbi:MAG: hypothetical protein V1922_01340 [bacterium]
MTTSTLLSSLPQNLVQTLIKEFIELHKNYFLGKWQISELNGGRFGEAVLRLIEFKDAGSYTPIGNPLPRRLIITHAAHNLRLEDSIRLYIPSATELIMDFRNNRDVAHLGTINVNEMDATFIIQTANWIMAEIVRIEGHASPMDAQNEIKKIIEKKIPIVEEIDGRLKTLDPKLTVKEKILVCLYQKFPQRINIDELLLWIKDKNPSRFKQYLNELDKKDLTDYTDQGVKLTIRGNLWVEKNIKFELIV